MLVVVSWIGFVNLKSGWRLYMIVDSNHKLGIIGAVLFFGSLIFIPGSAQSQSIITGLEGGETLDSMVMTISKSLYNLQFDETNKKIEYYGIYLLLDRNCCGQYNRPMDYLIFHPHRIVVYILTVGRENVSFATDFDAMEESPANGYSPIYDRSF